MKKKEEIEKLAYETLNSLDNLQQVEANEFLYGKVMNRMQSYAANERKAYNRLMLQLSLALMVFIGLNAVSFYTYERLQKQPDQKKVNGVSAFAEEYSLKSNAYGY